MIRKRSKIVFFDVCHNSSAFLSLAMAERAAEIHSHVVGYVCEAFQCVKGCPRDKHGTPNPDEPVYHIRGKMRSTDATTKNPPVTITDGLPVLQGL